MRIVSDSLCESDIFELGLTMQRRIIDTLTPDRMITKYIQNNNSCVGLQKTADLALC